MNTVTIVLLVILVVLIAAVVALYFFGKRAQKRQEEQQAQIEASKQTITMLVIDKKRMPIKQSGLPQMVIDQTPKLMRRTKLPIVKAKVGPKVQVLIADEKIFDAIPLKKEIKAEVSGLYIVGVRGIRGNLETAGKKKGIMARIKGLAGSFRNKDQAESKKPEKKAEAKKAEAAASENKPVQPVNNGPKPKKKKNRARNQNKKPAEAAVQEGQSASSGEKKA